MNGIDIGVLKESQKGDVDVICGGPPCPSITGFNRFKNNENPLDDNKNKQLIVYMNLVQHLKQDMFSWKMWLTLLNLQMAFSNVMPWVVSLA